MKKQFIYAALCIALMSSCSKDNDPGSISEPTTNTPDVIDEGSPVAIELGVGAPQVSVSTRGTGAAGIETEGDVALWDEQELKILMTKKNSLVLAKEDPNDETSKYIFEGLTFKAPASIVKDPTQMKITNTDGAVKYYPLQGAYDFYGFSFDDATLEGGTFEYPTTGEETRQITYTLTIDGTQDIMIAKAELTADQQGGTTSENGKLAPNDYSKAFSSWAARRGVQPTMNFEHLLSRLDFVAKVGETVQGEENIEVDESYPSSWPEADGYPQPIGNQLKNGVYIKGIKILNPKNKITVKIADLDSPETIGITNPIAEDNSEFTLQRRPSEDEVTEHKSKNFLPLIPETPGIAKDETLEIGDGIMIVPGDNSFDMEIELMQYVMKYDGSSLEHPKEYTWKEATLKTTVKLNDDDTFKAGNYYTITATIFGFQKIDVTATLSKWENGGNISTNPEDDAFNQ